MKISEQTVQKMDHYLYVDARARFHSIAILIGVGLSTVILLGALGAPIPLKLAGVCLVMVGTLAIRLSLYNPQASHSLNASIPDLGRRGFFAPLASAAALVGAAYVAAARGKDGSNAVLQSITSDLDKGLLAQLDQAMRMQTEVPQRKFKLAQETANYLLDVAPSSAETWRTVAIVANYRSYLFSRDSEKSSSAMDCSINGAVAAGTDIPLELIPAVMAKFGVPLKLISACTIHLDAVVLDQHLETLLFAGCYVIYSGGKLPVVANIVFYKCRFHMNADTVPSPSGKILMKDLLEADLNVPIEASGSES